MTTRFYDYTWWFYYQGYLRYIVSLLLKYWYPILTTMITQDAVMPNAYETILCFSMVVALSSCITSYLFMMSRSGFLRFISGILIWRSLIPKVLNIYRKPNAVCLKYPSLGFNRSNCPVLCIRQIKWKTLIEQGHLSNRSDIALECFGTTTC